MKEGQDKIDNLFKKRLEDPAGNLAYNEDDWDAMEQILDKGKKRPFIVYWLPVVSGIAAMLLLFLGWWFFKPTQTTVKKDDTVAVKPAVKGTDTTRINKTQAVTVSPQNSVAVNGTSAPASNTGKDTNYPLYQSKHRAPTRKAGAAVNTGERILANFGVKTQPQPQQNTLPAAGQKDTVPALRTDMVAVQRDTTPPTRLDAAKADDKQPVIAGNTPAQTPDKPKVKVKSLSQGRPQFAISVLASSDINGVNSFQQSKVGSNFGAMLSVSVKKWTFTTGAMYAIKPYATSFANYTTAYKFKSDPTIVTADCRMLDVPLNIGYQVYQNRKNKFSLGTGVSSYFMLHENYKYTYSSTYANGPTSYTVANPKNYLLSVINVNATFERQINSKFSLSVQPYMKLPIKAVGYSQVNLHTAGVAVGFNYNFNSFTKPK
ncbi:hypothetical protein [Mucilaginibacter psychrotolerans]|uniref:Outer membrane protein beta-barrel domain-containing protein n=1 Tax=Mucilaginibacter psychrotolerans TaxID=1524096 RepID=A0A4Y8SH55_9SPHI|nr:hypothetical protein [Mucilaginibacter psychrotolerans]TFF38202.1 hypothetical protein E2R66_09195 [Mucilaginibacter psychrotolerans]